MVQPRCPYFGQCAGCSAQHLDYATQCANKKQRLAQVLAKVLRTDAITVFSGEEYSYRNRLELLFSPQGIGLRMKDPQQIIRIDQCVICTHELNTLITEIIGHFRGVDAYDQRKKTGTFYSAILRSSTTGRAITFVLNPASSRLHHAIATIEAFAPHSTATVVLVGYVSEQKEGFIEDVFAVKGSLLMEEQYLGKSFSFPAYGFFQSNTKLAEELHRYCQNILQSYDTRNGSLLDLYAGVGTFGILNASLFKNVELVEEVPAAVEAARLNVQRHGLTNVHVFCRDARQLRNMKLGKPLFVITDPPRSGMDPQALTALMQLEPSVLLYVSCNPERLGKDLLKLKSYTLKSAALFDFFPQTPHLEAVVELVKM